MSKQYQKQKEKWKEQGKQKTLEQVKKMIDELEEKYIIGQINYVSDFIKELKRKLKELK